MTLNLNRIELLVIASVIAALGILAILAVGTARSQARDAVRFSDISQMRTGLDLYFNDHSEYPQADNVALGTPERRCLGQNGFSPSCVSATEAVYQQVIATPPRRGLHGKSSCSNERNAYCFGGFGAEYRIQFELERPSRVLGLPKGANCVTQSGFQAGACPALAAASVE